MCLSRQSWTVSEQLLKHFTCPKGSCSSSLSIAATDSALSSEALFILVQQRLKPKRLCQSREL